MLRPNEHMGPLIADPHFKSAWLRLQRCHKSSEKGCRRQNLRLIGVSGVGKSRLLIEYRDAHPPIHHEEYTEVPVLYAEVPAQPTSRQLAVCLLTALGRPTESGTAEELWAVFQRLCRVCKVRLILLDEIQHFVDRGRVSTYANDADILKQNLSKLGIPTVLAGAPRSRLLFEVNNQLRSRFKPIHALRPFAITNMDEIERFSTTVATAASSLPDKVLRFLISPAMIPRLFYATDGIFRNLLDFLDGVRAVLEDKTTCSLPLLSVAFHDTVWVPASKRDDPFAESFVPRRLTNPGEPFMPSPMDGDNHAYY
jgi:hypothetical protein